MVALPEAAYSAIEEFCDFHEFLCFSGACGYARQSGLERRFAYDCWAAQLRFSTEHEVMGSSDSDTGLDGWVPDFWQVWSSGNEFLED